MWPFTRACEGDIYNGVPIPESLSAREPRERPAPWLFMWTILQPCRARATERSGLPTMPAISWRRRTRVSTSPAPWRFTRERNRRCRRAPRRSTSPQGLAVTGDGGTLFVADEGGVLTAAPSTYTHGAVWAYKVDDGHSRRHSHQGWELRHPDGRGFGCHGQSLCRRLQRYRDRGSGELQSHNWQYLAGLRDGLEPYRSRCAESSDVAGVRSRRAISTSETWDPPA